MTRARVEHVFGAMNQMGGKLIRTIGQARQLCNDYDGGMLQFKAASVLQEGGN